MADQHADPEPTRYERAIAHSGDAIAYLSYSAMGDLSRLHIPDMTLGEAMAAVNCDIRVCRARVLQFLKNTRAGDLRDLYQSHMSMNQARIAVITDRRSVAVANYVQTRWVACLSYLK
jgi:hypothetical protein